MTPRIKRWADTHEVRQWAKDLSNDDRKRLNISDIDVSDRGRLHSKIIRAFNQSMRSQGIRYVPIGRNQPRIDEVFEAADREDDTPVVYRQPRQEPAQEMPEIPNTPAAVMEVLKSTHQPVVVVYVPVS